MTSFIIKSTFCLTLAALSACGKGQLFDPVAPSSGSIITDLGPADLSIMQPPQRMPLILTGGSQPGNTNCDAPRGFKVDANSASSIAFTSPKEDLPKANPAPSPGQRICYFRSMPIKIPGQAQNLRLSFKETYNFSEPVKSMNFLYISWATLSFVGQAGDPLPDAPILSFHDTQGSATTIDVALPDNLADMNVSVLLKWQLQYLNSSTNDVPFPVNDWQISEMAIIYQ